MNRLLALALLPLSLAALAAGEPEINVVIEGHKFTPDRIEIAAGKKVKLLVENKDATPEEFESGSLKIEKVIPVHIARSDVQSAARRSDANGVAQACAELQVNPVARLCAAQPALHRRQIRLVVAVKIPNRKA